MPFFLVLQKLLGAVPGGYAAQRWYTVASRRQDRFLTTSAVLGYTRRQLDVFAATSCRPPLAVLEQGTGALGRDLVLFRLAGAERIVTYDTTPWLNVSALRRFAGILATHPYLMFTWPGIDPDAVVRRANALRHVVRHGGVSELLAELRVERRIARDPDRSDLPSHAFDLFFTNSVLQFMVPGDIDALLRQLPRLLKPRGAALQIVDCVDYYPLLRHRGRLAYLTIPDVLWSLLTSRYLTYQNRLRLPDFAKRHQAAGFSIRFPLRCIDAESLPLANELRHRSRYAAMTAEEIAVTRFVLIAELAHRRRGSLRDG